MAGERRLRFWRKDKAKPRVFLGTLAVVPREDLKWVLEDMLGDPGSEIEGALHAELEEIFALAPASSADPVLKTDLCVDVFIPGYHTGMAETFELPGWTIPLIWRPKIELKARLYRLHDRKLIKTFTVKERPTYKECFAAAFSWRAVFGFGPPVNDGDMAYLLNRASLRLLRKIAKVAYA